MKVAAIGRTEMLYDSILELKRRGHNIVLIITCDSSQLQYNGKAHDFKLLADELNADFLITEKINSSQVLNIIKEKNPDIAISVNWKTVIGQKVIDSFHFGILNAHAGDLPRYKGNSVRNWAIIAGEKEIALTIHYMTTDLDAGAILLKKKRSININTRIEELYNFVIKNTPIMFAEVVDGLENGTIIPRVQPMDPKKSLRTYPRLPRDSEIDWNKKATDIDRLIRASSEPFLGAYSFIGTEKIIIWKAHVEIPKYEYLSIPGQVVKREPKTGEIIIATGDGFLVLEEIESVCKGRTKTTAIIKTIRTRLGMDISEEIQNLIKQIKDLKNEIKKLKR